MARERKGFVFEREPGTWYARVTLTDQNGKRRDLWRKGDNKTEAKELLKKLVRDLEDSNNTVIEGNKITLNKYLDRWLTMAAKGRLSERSYADYEDLLRRYVRPAMGRKKLSDLRPLDVQSLYSSMQEQGGSWVAFAVFQHQSESRRKQKRARDEAEALTLLKQMEQELMDSAHRILRSGIERRALSARTVRYTHAVLSSAFKQAVKWGLIPRNPASLAELPKQVRQEMSALSRDEARRFVAACANDRSGMLFSFALVTGTRPEEYLGLQWKDINLESGIVMVQRTLCWRRRGGGWYFSEPKTARSRRSIPLPFSLIRALAEHKRGQAEERLNAGPKYTSNDLIFATSDGGPLMPQNLFRRHFKPILKSAGLPETIRLYDLRHSCATLLLETNENPKVVSERLGHASITLTLDTYSHVLPSMQQAATEKLEGLLFGPTKQKTLKKPS